jgi:hypothetical protein
MSRDNDARVASMSAGVVDVPDTPPPVVLSLL